MKLIKLPRVQDLSRKQLKGKRVIVRLDLNVLSHGAITETYRIDRSLPTLEFLKEQGAKIVVISHVGDSAESLKPVAIYLNRKLQAGFTPSLDELDVMNCVPDGSITILENLRRHKGEEGNSVAFAKALASHGDLYVNDAFAASHREHASIVGLPKLLPSYAGLLLQEEVKELSTVFTPKHPFVAIIGGAKFATKLPLLKRFVKTADQVFVVGALAHSFFKKKRLVIGKSLVDTKVKGIEPFLKSKKIVLPIDTVVENGNGYYVKKVDQIGADDVIYDAGPDTIELMKTAIGEAGFVLWNGPLGNFEKGYDRGTLEVAKAIAKGRGRSVIGGGDTIAAISRLDSLDRFDFISTGGGAMLDFLSAGTLPGIEALLKKRRK